MATRMALLQHLHFLFIYISSYFYKTEFIAFADTKLCCYVAIGVESCEVMMLGIVVFVVTGLLG